MKTILATSHLSVKINEKELFQALNLKFSTHTINAVVGENGVGKTTFLNYLSGIKKTDKGTITLNGKNLHSFSLRERTQSIASLGQNDLSTDDLLGFKRIAQGLVPRYGSLAPVSEEIKVLVQQSARLCNVSHLLERRLGSLSGGERKRINIARCLVDDQAKIYILDEPFAHLDSYNHVLLANSLSLLAGQGKCIIFSVHNQGIADTLPNQLITLEPGKASCLWQE